MSLVTHLICIDVQNDFTRPGGALFVPGGHENAQRSARMIERLTDKIDEIHVTLDSHNLVDISHPMWWRDRSGNPPDPFTMIAPEDVESGKWTTRIHSHRERSLKYLKALKATGRYPHVIWPPHCLIGDEGHNLHKDLSAAIHQWETKRYAVKNAVTKGSNIWTEHFSAVRAEVPDPEDPTTQINQPLISTLETADVVIWVGEALSHCLANTFRDTVANFSNPEFVKKMVLLTDASSSVTGFEKQGDDFVREMVAKGMRVSTTKDILA